MRSILFALLGLFFTAEVLAQDEYYDNVSLDESIATVILQKNIGIYDPSPIINLGTNETLKLSFDKLEPQNEFLNYSMIHCDRNWEPSNLQQMD